MAISAADLIVSFTTKGVDTVTGALGDVDGRLGRFQQSTIGAGRALTGMVTVPVAGFFAGAFMGAASLEQSMGKVDAVFGSAAGSIIQWSEGSAAAFGMSQNEALQATGTFGALFSMMGNGQKESGEYSKSLIALSADMGAFNDISSTRASDAIMAGLTGEYMSLRGMGVFLDEVIVAEEALAIATADGRTEITAADKVMARYNLILEQTTQQQGQFAREADGASGSLAVARAEAIDAAAALGTQLLPVGTSIIKWLTGMIRKFSELSPSMMKWVTITMLGAAALGPLLAMIGMMIPAISALGSGIGLMAKVFPLAAKGIKLAAIAMRLLTLSMLANPVVLVVAAIIALGVGIFILYKRSETFRKAVHALWGGLKQAGAAVMDFVRWISDLSGAIDDTMSFLGVFRAMLGGLFDSAAESAGFFGDTVRRIGGVIDGALGFVQGMLKGIGQLLQGDLTGALGTFGTAFLGLFTTLANAWLLLPRLILDAFQAIPWTSIGSGALNLIMSGLRAGAGAVGNLWGWITDSLSNAISSMRSSVSAGISLAWDAITDWLPDVPDFGDWATRFLDWLPDVPDFGDWASRFTDWLPTIPDFDIPGVGSWAQLLTNWLPDIPDFHLPGIGSWLELLTSWLPDIPDFDIPGVGSWSQLLTNWLPDIPNFDIEWSSLLTGWLPEIDEFPGWGFLEEWWQKILGGSGGSAGRGDSGGTGRDLANRPGGGLASLGGGGSTSFSIDTSSATTALANLRTALGETSAAIPPVSEQFRAAAGQWASPVQTALGSIKTAFNSELGQVTGITRSQMGASQAAVSVSTSIMAGSGIGNTQRMAGGMRGAANEASGGIRAAAGTWPGIVSTGANRMVGAARAAGGGMRGAGEGIGSALGAGVHAGIGAWAGRVASSAANLVTGAIAAAHAAAKLGSPSKPMTYIGEMMGIAPILAVERLIPRMHRTMADLVRMPAAPPLAFNYAATAATAAGGHGFAGGGPISGAIGDQEIHYHDERVYNAELKLSEFKELVEANDFINDLRRSHQVVFGRGRR